MTIAIAQTLPDGVLLVADGRHTWPFCKGKAPLDNIDKLVRLRNNVYAIPFGVALVTDQVLTHLHADQSYRTPEDLSERMERLIRVEWANFWTKLGSDVNRQDPSLQAVMIAGGILNGESFIVGSGCGNYGHRQPIIQKLPSRLYIVGGEDQNAESLFIQTVAPKVRGLKWDYENGPINKTIRTLLDTSESIIRHVHKRNGSVGGVIRYAIIRKCFLPQKAILCEINDA